MSGRVSRFWRRATVDAFGRALPFVDWSFFLIGVAGTVGTAAGWLPPFSGSLWGRVSTSVVWLVLARQGYDPLAETAKEEAG